MAVVEEAGPHHHRLRHWPVVKVVQEAVGHWMVLQVRMLVASVVAVLAVGRSPAVSEVTVAALASVEPVVCRTVAVRYRCHSFVHSWWAVPVEA